ncbi:Eco57I restriction-modification methylase domain-containing protein [Capillimicrobium parvum]|uniref:site-specific DNA-methyltransferase (adenine-specific) n=1 Tax=Capillimicrobium parvum TaxID=2884022 RepID=A0A9E6Y1L0_9ACTN|nr:N-6 DNA methylase [Capillimicrobium parvum]UGS38522.1 hypothetical protein DSM104329_04951 [Capillimicrobium parvum]
MRLRSKDLFQTIRTEGGLLPADLLQRVADGDSQLDGLGTSTYHLAPNERLNERITGSWNRLRGAWSAFSAEREKLADSETGARITREHWQHVLFDELGYGRLVQERGVQVEDKLYPVFSHWHHSPIHLVGCNTPLDRRSAGVQGAATQSPHSLIQELLNRSESRLWGFVTNGLLLRVLRDNVTLTRQAYVEFDLEAMFDSEAYADFAVLWLVCHQSRVEADPPTDCWLERWTQAAAHDGTRALETLRDGVENAIQALGSGFLARADNAALRSALRDGQLSPEDYYRALLRLVYRLLFLFVAEDRQVLLVGDDSQARARYDAHYSTARLRRLAGRRRGGLHPDLYEQLKLVMGYLHEDGCKALGLPALGSSLWDPTSVGPLAEARLSNEYLLDALRELAYVEEGQVLRAVDFRNLGPEELGSVYESLLDLQAEFDVGSGAFALLAAPGSERQTTDAHYTPQGLIALLLDSTLDPVLDAAEQSDDPETALLQLKVCDPACGSGHFLIAAAHRISKRLAAARAGESEPSPSLLREALRDVISRCVYGVDVNPMAIELCKVSLWLEAMVPGRPLTFLDAHLRAGNSLLGTTPGLVDDGVPDSAYKALLGDDKDVTKSIRTQNAAERRGQLTMADAVSAQIEELADAAMALDSVADASLHEVREHEQVFRRLEASDVAQQLRSSADGWTCAFLAPKDQGSQRVTTGMVRRLGAGVATADEHSAVQDVASAFRPFHWAVEFPSVFVANGGFDAIVGNPPWGRVKLQDKRFFAVPAPEIAAAANKSKREKLITELSETDPELLSRYRKELRRYEALSHFFHRSGVYPLTGVGDVNTYALFAELASSIVREGGRFGMVLQGGIVTDDTTKAFFSHLVDAQRLASVYGFENEEKLFPAVHNQTKFCVLSAASRGEGPEEFELSFFNRQPATARDPDRLFRLTAEDVAAINPNTRTCPVFRSAKDAEVIRALHRRFPILVTDGPPERNPWGVRFQSMFHMANDSGLFRTEDDLDELGAHRDGEVWTRDEQRFVPLLEGKMAWLWNPRFGTYEGQTQAQANKGVLPPSTVEQLTDPDYVNRPRYWVEERLVRAAWKGESDWALAWRDLGPSERTFIVSAVPVWGAGHTFPLMHIPAAHSGLAPCLLAALSSLVVDYAARGRTATGRMVMFVVKHFPVPEPQEFAQTAPWDRSLTLREWVNPRALELIFTTGVLRPLARDAGHQGQPFGWDVRRRRHLQAELDAAFFLLAGLSREQTEHVLASFRVLGENEEKLHDEFLTRRLVLESYDALASASATSRPPEPAAA